MFELIENPEEDEFNSEITKMLNDNNIPLEYRDDLRCFLLMLLNSNRSEFETTVAIFISLYVVGETSNWRTYLTEDNIDIFVCDSVLIMCSEGQFLTDQPWCGTGGKPYDLFGNLLAFLSEQFITIFQP
jgi:hypothetical protein